MTDLATFNDTQTRQLTILALRGFTLRVVWRDEEKHQVVVAGRDPANARLIGKVDVRGAFVGELIDFRPSLVAVSAPPEHATVDELIR